MSQAQALWEQLAEQLETADPAVSRSTMMGLPCLRLAGSFFASFDKRHDQLIVKLSAHDVATRVADGRGRSFAPAGKVFKEWLAIDEVEEATWRAALDSALGFVRGV